MPKLTFGQLSYHTTIRILLFFPGNLLELPALSPPDSQKTALMKQIDCHFLVLTLVGAISILNEAYSMRDRSFLMILIILYYYSLKDFLCRSIINDKKTIEKQVAKVKNPYYFQANIQ